MPRVGAPDGRVREVDGISGRRYRSRDGLYEMSDRDAKALVKAGGFIPDLGGRIQRGGFACRCGFRSFFRRCSRCGAECERDT